jgi:hypothetical protein
MQKLFLKKSFLSKTYLNKFYFSSPLTVGVPKEIYLNEKRVGISPEGV